MQNTYDVLLKLLENTPLIWIVSAILLTLVSAIIVIIYLVAFIQGREISFWPPKIGKIAKESLDVIKTDKRKSRLPEISTPSPYNPIDDNSRLNVQGSNNSSFDELIFKKALSLVKKKSDLVALDIGCADGFVTVDRFSKFECFSKVYAVDNNSTLVSVAKQKYGDEKYSFRVANIEIEDDVLSLFNHQGGVDFVFLSYTLHHLADPLVVLSKIKKIINPNGVLVVRSIDDGCKLFYSNGHGSSLNEIFDRLMEISSYEGDRNHGRKLYCQLRLSGFNEIQMHYQSKDTIKMSNQDRAKTFNESLAWRAEPIKSLLENGSIELKKEYEWAVEAIESLERVFVHDDSLYYMETQHVAIAVVE